MDKKYYLYSAIAWIFLLVIFTAMIVFNTDAFPAQTEPKSWTVDYVSDRFIVINSHAFGIIEDCETIDEQEHVYFLKGKPSGKCDYAIVKDLDSEINCYLTCKYQEP